MSPATHFIVTTSALGASRKQVWKPDEPLKIGFPMQWLMESTGEGVRITYLGGKSGALSKERVREIPFARLLEDPRVLLEAGPQAAAPGPGAQDTPGAKAAGRAASPIELRIEPASSIAPAFAQGAPSRAGGQVLAVYRTLGNWVLEAHRVEGNFAARVGGTRVFSLRRAGSETRIIPHAPGLGILRKGGARGELQGDGLALSPSELADSTLVFKNPSGKNPSGATASWRFGWMAANPPAATQAQRLPVLELSADSEAPAFKKQLRNSAIGLLALLALGLLWPKPKPDSELIPPQLARIILTPPKLAAQAASESSPVKSAAQRKIQQTAVVQAFRAKALQSAVSQLMKGGMTRLLAQSDFIEGHRQSAELGRILETQSKDLRDLSPRIGGLDTRNLAVASLGGDGVSGKTGKSVGYGKGERAAVLGQGKAFVSMDIADSQVDDGLTKDQVGEVIHRHLSEVRYCYESAMIRMPDIEGKLVVDFTIGGNGIVKTADAKESTLPDPRLDDCILRRLASWKFPLPRGGVDVAVTYPFIFKTLGR